MCSRLQPMSSLFIGLITLFLATPSACAGKMPPGSFLRKPVNCAEELLHQFERDALVRKRYVCLYARPPSYIRRAFVKMKLTSLSRDRILQVFYVHPGEIIGYKLRRVRRGTKVFVQSNGLPALIAACGNPVQADLEVERIPPTEQEKLIVLEFEPTEPLVPPPDSPVATIYAAFGGEDEIGDGVDMVLSALLAPPVPSAPSDIIRPVFNLDPPANNRHRSERPRTPEPGIFPLVLSIGIVGSCWWRRVRKRINNCSFGR
ncbi:MAG TPA: hypothetical protein VNJ09_01885 [Chthonomonadales bacterium]|nr:hypothetical protein [Chthonomonadales bacterium]